MEKPTRVAIPKLRLECISQKKKKPKKIDSPISFKQSDYLNPESIEYSLPEHVHYLHEETWPTKLIAYLFSKVSRSYANNKEQWDFSPVVAAIVVEKENVQKLLDTSIEDHKFLQPIINVTNLKPLPFIPSDEKVIYLNNENEYSNLIKSIFSRSYRYIYDGHEYWDLRPSLYAFKKQKQKWEQLFQVAEEQKQQKN